MKSHSGFAHIALVIIIVVLVIGGLGFVLFRNLSQTHENTPGTTATTSNKEADPTRNTGLHSSISIWAGYVAYDDAFTSVKGRVKVPAVTCTNEEDSVTVWVGFDGSDNATVEQTGFTAGCTSAENYSSNPPINGVYYYAWSLVYGGGTMNILPMSITPGDIIEYEVAFKGGKYEMTVTNKTTNQTQTDIQACVLDSVTATDPRGGCTQKTVEWIVERAGFGSLAKFEPIELYDNSATTAEKGTKYIDEFPNYGYDMINEAGLLLATTSVLRSKGVFDVGWVTNGSSGN